MDENQVPIDPPFWIAPPKGSGNVEFYHYEPFDKMLFIKFKAGAAPFYRYDGVHALALEELLAADSFGSFLNRHIQPNFRYSHLKSDPAVEYAPKR